MRRIEIVTAPMQRPLPCRDSNVRPCSHPLIRLGSRGGVVRIHHKLAYDNPPRWLIRSFWRCPCPQSCFLIKIHLGRRECGNGPHAQDGVFSAAVTSCWLLICRDPGHGVYGHYSQIHSPWWMVDSLVPVRRGRIEISSAAVRCTQHGFTDIGQTTTLR